MTPVAVTPVAAMVALACWVPPPAPAPDLDRVVAVLRGEVVPPPPARADVAAALVRLRRARP